MWEKEKVGLFALSLDGVGWVEWTRSPLEAVISISLLCLGPILIAGLRNPHSRVKQAEAKNQ